MFFLKGFIDFLTIILRRPKFLAMTCIIVFVAVVTLCVYGTRVVTDIPVYVVDHDNSTVSRTIRLYLDSGPDLKVLGTIESLDEGRQLLYDGQIGGIIYIPAGLSQSIKTQNGGQIFAYIDGTNMLMAKNVDKAVQTVVKTASVGVSMIAIQKKGMPEQALMGSVMPINLDVDRPFNALTVYSEYLLPVLIFFCLNIFTCIMTCACYQEAIPVKIKSHVIRRRVYYFGRLVAVFILAFIFGLVIYLQGLPRVDIVLQSTPFMALSALVVYIVLSMTMFSIINIVLPLAVSMSLSYLICMLSVMFSGLTWPLEMMPWYLQFVASWIPLTPFLQSVQVFLYHDANWSDLWEFYQMFLKQAVVYIICIFAIMRIKDIRLIIKWGIHKIRREREIHASLEMVAADASPALSSLLLDKEREAIRSSQSNQAVSRDLHVPDSPPVIEPEAIKEDDIRSLVQPSEAIEPGGQKECIENIQHEMSIPDGIDENTDTSAAGRSVSESSGEETLLAPEQASEAKTLPVEMHEGIADSGATNVNRDMPEAEHKADKSKIVIIHAAKKEKDQ
ncbi:MAG: ABC transporter permease [Proteobacteria bacterium]|nr:ABC transporter permease [Pseudomonadota bacterium]